MPKNISEFKKINSNDIFLRRFYFKLKCQHIAKILYMFRDIDKHNV